jgi:hypothetical protein
VPRLVIAFLALFFALVPAASAEPPKITVTSAAGSARAFITSGNEAELAPPHLTVIYDGCLVFGRGCPPPTLQAAPGETVTITLERAVDEFVGSVGGTTASRVDDTTWTLTLPHDQALPVDVSMGIRDTTDTHRLSFGYLLQLVALPPPPAPPEPTLTTLPTAAPPPVVASVARTARLRGRTLTLTVACPAGATQACRGTVNVRARGRTITRITFTGIAPGTSRAISGRTRSAARGKLRAVVTTPGAAPVTSRLTLRVRR